MEQTFDFSFGPIRMRLPEDVHLPPASTVELAGLLDIRPRDHVLELGCGSGLLSLVSVRLGAERVIATDISPRALAATACNARINGLESAITCYEGFWFDALPEHDRGPFDVIIATPPQTPSQTADCMRGGGPDGLAHLTAIIAGAPGHLKLPSGRLWLLAISLADGESLMKLLRRHFTSVDMVKETERFFTVQEYDDLEPGRFSCLQALRSRGTAELYRHGNGRLSFRNRFLRAAGARTP